MMRYRKYGLGGLARDERADRGLRQAMTPELKEILEALALGCAVKADARGMDIGITTIGPIDEVRHRLQQGLA